MNEFKWRPCWPTEASFERLQPEALLGSFEPDPQLRRLSPEGPTTTTTTITRPLGWSWPRPEAREIPCLFGRPSERQYDNPGRSFRRQASTCSLGPLEIDNHSSWALNRSIKGQRAAEGEAPQGCCVAAAKQVRRLACWLKPREAISAASWAAKRVEAAALADLSLLGELIALRPIITSAPVSASLRAANWKRPALE